MRAARGRDGVATRVDGEGRADIWRAHGRSVIAQRGVSRHGELHRRLPLREITATQGRENETHFHVVRNNNNRSIEESLEEFLLLRRELEEARKEEGTEFNDLLPSPFSIRLLFIPWRICIFGFFKWKQTPPPFGGGTRGWLGKMIGRGVRRGDYAPRQSRGRGGNWKPRFRFARSWNVDAFFA